MPRVLAMRAGAGGAGAAGAGAAGAGAAGASAAGAGAAAARPAFRSLSTRSDLVRPHGARRSVREVQWVRWMQGEE